MTPLHEAVRRGNRPLTELLLAHGADPRLADDVGNTAFRVAARTRNKAIMAMQSYNTTEKGNPADSGPASANVGNSSENAR